jgi:penicillin-binding protein 1A
MDYSRHNTEKERRRIRSAAAKIERKVGFNVLRFSAIAVIIVAAVAIAAVAGGFRGIIDSAPEISTNQIMPSKFKSVMYYPDGTEAIELVGAQSNRTVVKIEDLPSVVPEAFVAIEDERFYEHNGIDPRGIIRAMFVGLGSGNFSEGASTITQQLIKITVFKVTFRHYNSKRCSTVSNASDILKTTCINGCRCVVFITYSRYIYSRLTLVIS